MKNFLSPRDISKKITSRLRCVPWLQGPEDSFRLHHAEFEDGLKRPLEDVVQESQLHAARMFNSPSTKIDQLLDEHPEVRALAVDIGSGDGWQSACLSRYFEKVIGIEPSAAAIQLSRAKYADPAFANIEWKHGFAEDKLNALAITRPALFVTGHVLSHLTNDAVANICQAINRAAPAGSILSFSELWSVKSRSSYMCYVRSQRWWEAQLPGWLLCFHGPELPEMRGVHKGIHGVKRTWTGKQ